jgi:hypothetical protein
MKVVPHFGTIFVPLHKLAFYNTLQITTLLIYYTSIIQNWTRTIELFGALLSDGWLDGVKTGYDWIRCIEGGGFRA